MEEKLLIFVIKLPILNIAIVSISYRNPAWMDKNNVYFHMIEKVKSLLKSVFQADDDA
jgi:hypothetical protein